MRNNVDCSTHLLLLMSYAEEQKLCFECLKIELNKSYRRKLIVWKKFFGAMLSGEGGGGEEREREDSCLCEITMDGKCLSVHSRVRSLVTIVHSLSQFWPRINSNSNSSLPLETQREETSVFPNEGRTFRTI